MRTTFRRNTIAVAAVVAAGAVALSAPVVAKGVFDASNAHKVDGLHAKDLTKTQYFAAQTTFDDFNTCTFTPVLTRVFKTSHTGVVSVVANVNAARDTNNANEGILTTRVLIDGVAATAPASGNLENDGTLDATVTAIGGRKVSPGTHSVVLQAMECGPGMAFVTSESMVVSYSPFGSAATAPTSKIAVKGSPNS